MDITALKKSFLLIGDHPPTALVVNEGAFVSDSLVTGLQCMLLLVLWTHTETISRDSWPISATSPLPCPRGERGLDWPSNSGKLEWKPGPSTDVKSLLVFL